MKRSFLFNQGLSPYAEDGLVNTCDFVGVLDGVSTPYSPDTPPIVYNGLSSGEMVVRTIEGVFTRYATPQLEEPASLDFAIAMANSIVRDKQAAIGGIAQDCPGCLAGAAFALARIGEDTIEIAQAGDCFAILAFPDEVVLAHPYQMHGHEAKDRERVRRVMQATALEIFSCSPEEVPPEKRAALQREFWNRYRPVWEVERAEDINNPASPDGFGLLNGQPRLKEMIWKQEVSRDKLKAMLFLTDGMVPRDTLETGSKAVIANRVFKLFRQNGWPAVLAAAREAERKRDHLNYTSQAEATGLAIEF